MTRVLIRATEGHWMFTIGSESGYALRVTRGRLDRRGRWHSWQPCVFLIVKGKRWP